MPRLFAFFLGILMCGAALAIPLERKLFQLQHQNWKAKDGVPQSIATIAQTDDGYLWLGTSAGLYRFDGVHFELYEPRAGKLPQGFVYYIKSQPGVGLWIGWGVGGISLIRDGVVTHFAADSGVSESSWWGFAFDRQGNVWAAGADGLLRFDGKKWHRLGEPDGFTARKASAVFVDKQGTVAAFSEKGLFLKPADKAVFSPPFGRTDVRQPPQLASDGRIYFMEESSIRVINSLARYEKPDHPPIFKGKPGDSQSMLIDRSGSFWYETLGGVHRTDPDHPRTVETFNDKNGLSSNTITCLFEDREGNIWLSTNDGLDRFRQVDVNKVRPTPDIYSLNQSGLLAGSGNVMTLAAPDYTGGWIALSPDGAVQNLDWLRRHPEGRIQAIAPGRDGSTLVADRRGLHRILKNQQEETIPWPADLGPIQRVRSVAEGGDGVLWIGVLGVGVLEYKQGQWQHNPLFPKGGIQTPLAIFADSKGRIWLGYTDNKVVLVDKDKVTAFTSANGVDLGRVAVIVEAEGRIIAGGEKGMAIFHDDHFQAWRIGAKQFVNTSSIVHAKDGDLWVNSTAGTIRVTAALKSLLNGAEIAPSQIRVLDAVDGRLGVSNLLQDYSLAEAGDGKIWIANDSGVSWIDPRHLLKVPVPPPALVDLLIVDKQSFRAPLDVTLGPSSHAIQINYSSPLLGTPERMRFKYRLEGYDTEWQDAGPRRQAFYTGVPPGRYHFRVIAANGNDNWSNEGPGVFLTLEPTYYQTLWFKALMGVIIALLIWLAVQFRLRRTAQTLKMQMEARHGERERIARELHDTLLQGMQALILDVDNAAKRLAPDEPARDRFSHLLVKAETVLAEGRDQVFDLRGSDFYDTGAFSLIRRDGALLATEAEVKFVCEEQGKPRLLSPSASHEIYRIGMEAITNAVKHAQARTLVVSMRYAFFALHLEVRDDGIGIPADVLKNRGAEGHFGIQGLYERAARMHAVLTIASEVSCGTSIKLRIPARLAYSRKPFISFISARN